MSDLALFTDTWSPDDITALIARNGGSAYARTRLDAELIAALANLRQMGMSKDAACKLVGLSPSTYRQWLDRREEGEPYATFAQVMDACDSAVEHRLVNLLWKALEACDNPVQILKVLARYFPTEWGEKDARLKVEHEVTVHPAIRAAVERVRERRSAEVIELEAPDE